MVPFVLTACVSATRAAGPGSAEDASTAFIAAVLMDDAETVASLTESGFDLGTPAELRADYFRLSEPRTQEVMFELVDRFDAGEESGHEGLRYRVTDAATGDLVGEMTVYVGVERGVYFVWGVST